VGWGEPDASWVRGEAEEWYLVSQLGRAYGLKVECLLKRFLDLDRIVLEMMHL
jgi:hypothetical protein